MTGTKWADYALPFHADGAKQVGRGFPRGVADWLGLAAAPTFAIMALLTVVLGGPADMVCAAAHGGSPLNGMALMYLLMSGFHLPPWLKLISSWRYPGQGGDRLL